MNNDFWNERYSSDEYIFGANPNEYFKSKIAELKPGRILVPAAGEGVMQFMLLLLDGKLCHLI